MFLKMTLSVVLGNFIYHYLQSFLFCIFKAEKYEDTLAKKISAEVKANQII